MPTTFALDIGARILQAVAHPGLGGEMNDHVGTKLGVDARKLFSVLEHQLLGGEMRRLQQDCVTAPLERDVVVRRHAVDPDHVVAGLDQPLGDVEADEAGRSCHEKAHSVSFRGLLWNRSPACPPPRPSESRPWRVDPITP